jgi:hypothetical protein
MQQQPLVTIMVPTYGQERFIAEAVASALAQDYPNLEVVVADDCSPDETASAVAPFLADPRVRYVRNARNLGRIGNYRHCLFSLARGEWCLNLDGDDYLSNPAYISAAMRVALSDPDVVLVCGNIIAAHQGQAWGLLMNSALDAPLIASGERFLVQHTPGLSAVRLTHLASLYRRSAALACDFYRQDTLCGDTESLYRIAIGAKLAIINDVAGVWRHHDSNATRVELGKMADAEEQRADGIRQWIIERGRSSTAEIRRIDRRLTLGLLMAQAAASMDAGRPLEILAAVSRAFSLGPTVGLLLVLMLAGKTTTFLLRRVGRVAWMHLIGRLLPRLLTTAFGARITAWVSRSRTVDQVPAAPRWQQADERSPDGNRA